jgi:hypothetical protein
MRLLGISSCDYAATIWERFDIQSQKRHLVCIGYLAMGVYYEQRKALGFDQIPSATETPILK